MVLHDFEVQSKVSYFLPPTQTQKNSYTPCLPMFVKRFIKNIKRTCYNKANGADLILKPWSWLYSESALEECIILRGNIFNYKSSSSFNAYSSNVSWWYTRGDYSVTILVLRHQIAKLIIDIYCPDDKLELRLSISNTVVPYKCGIVSLLDVTWVVWFFCEAYGLLLKNKKQTVTGNRRITISNDR